jgi:hypothetical protein
LQQKSEREPRAAAPWQIHRGNNVGVGEMTTGAICASPSTKVELSPEMLWNPAGRLTSAAAVSAGRCAAGGSRRRKPGPGQDLCPRSLCTATEWRLLPWSRVVSLVGGGGTRHIIAVKAGAAG